MGQVPVMWVYIKHPVAFFSRKLNSHEKKYSTIEKEALALLTSPQHFEVYVGDSSEPTVVYSDQNLSHL